MFESGTILIYLAEKTGKLMPTEPQKRYQVLEWLMFQMAGLGPMFGQLNHFKKMRQKKFPTRSHATKKKPYDFMAC